MLLFPDDYSCRVGEKFACKRHDKIQRCIDKQYLCDYRNDCWNTELGSDEYTCCKYCEHSSCTFIYMLSSCPNWKSSYYEESDRIPLTGLTPPNFCS